MSLESIKNRISSIQTTSKITNAMKLVAAAELNRAKKTFDQSKEYYSEYYKVVGTILKLADKSFLSNSHSNDKTLYILITSSMGLCGGYNNNIYKFCKNLILKDDLVLVLGRKGIEHYKKSHPKNFLKDLSSDQIKTYDEVATLTSELYKKFKANEFSSIKIIYTKFINAITFKPDLISLIPFDSKFTNFSENLNESMFDFEPNKTDMLKTILPQYLSSVLYASILESRICENASRRNAMDNSTKNAKDLISNCKLMFNRLRQAKITNEITEIVAGSQDN